MGVYEHVDVSVAQTDPYAKKRMVILEFDLRCDVKVVAEDAARTMAETILRKLGVPAPPPPDWATRGSTRRARRVAIRCRTCRREFMPDHPSLVYCTHECRREEQRKKERARREKKRREARAAKPRHKLVLENFSG